MSNRPFQTDSVPLATYLHASGLLQLLKVESMQGGRYCEFAFADPHGRGADYQAAFENGAEVPAIHFFESYKTLRRFMRAAKESDTQTDTQDVRS